MRNPKPLFVFSMRPSAVHFFDLFLEPVLRRYDPPSLPDAPLFLFCFSFFLAIDYSLRRHFNFILPLFYRVITLPQLKNRGSENRPSGRIRLILLCCLFLCIIFVIGKSCLDAQADPVSISIDIHNLGLDDLSDLKLIAYAVNPLVGDL